MADSLLSVGLDVGTTTTQFVLSRLTVENAAGSFRVPKLQITDRQILAKSPVHFTPLLSENRVDGAGVRQLLEEFYRSCGVTPDQVDTGAVIITGETSRKENAAAVLESISHLAGDFVAATAGPHLESVLAAKGAGACARSEKTHRDVLHIDIGGGTSNLALLRQGEILQTGCMNVGGRLLKFSQTGMVTYSSPVLEGLTDLRPGEQPRLGQLEDIAQMLCRGLEMAAGLRSPTDLLQKLWTEEAGPVWDIPDTPPVLSFSGGVADCILQEAPDFAYGDLGAFLGRAIRASRLCQGEFVLGRETIRATVIGAGRHSATLSGSTVFCRDMLLPVKNLPVAVVREGRFPQTEDAQKALLYFPGGEVADYATIRELAQQLAAQPTEEFYICTETDMAKALGQALALLKPEAKILCIDGLTLTGDSYLDVGKPVGAAFPVVIKTLVLSGN